jgi:hypothetical protein
MQVPRPLNNPCIFNSTVLILMIILIRFFSVSRKSLPGRLFAAALQDENSGNFEMAVINYKTALEAAGTRRFHGNLKERINEKLKVLYMVIEYRRSVNPRINYE